VILNLKSLFVVIFFFSSSFTWLTVAPFGGVQPAKVNTEGRSDPSQSGYWWNQNVIAYLILGRFKGDEFRRMFMRQGYSNPGNP
jgi:hypothetical protein